MPKKNLRVLIGAFIILSSIGVLAYSGTQDNLVYYVTVSEFARSEATAPPHHGVRVTGLVRPGTIAVGADQRTVRFTMQDEKQPGVTLPVSYSGIIPDTFKEGRQVVVEGRLTDGVFNADVLLAKCPSKYEARDADPPQDSTAPR